MNKRASGILLHVTSLPSPYGIGDLGPSAYEFVDYLSGNKQRLWQILPLNPIDLGNGCSPYHSPSAFACSPLLISPDLLIRDGFLQREDVGARPDFPEDRVDYDTVMTYKNTLFQRALERSRRFF